MPTILIVENEQVHVLAALKKLQSFSVVIMRTRGELLAQMPVMAAPDVILLDRELGDAAGKSSRHLRGCNDSLELVSKIRQLYPNTRIIIWSSLDDQDFIKEAYNAGANGFITKIRIRYLVDDIQLVLSKDSWIELSEDEG